MASLPIDGQSNSHIQCLKSVPAKSKKGFQRSHGKKMVVVVIVGNPIYNTMKTAMCLYQYL
jgi:hypothetical protein